MAVGLFKIIRGLLIKKEGSLTPDQIEIVPNGSADTTTTIQSSQTADRTITLPDGTTTLVGTGLSQTLTNKTIDADQNTITNIENADIKSGAAIAKDKLAAGTANRVSVTDGSGFLVESTVTDTDLLVLGGLAGDTLVTTTGTQVLTNKSIDADLNTITNIENADIKVGAAIDATKIADGSVSNTEFQYIGGLTSDAQTQINAKVSKAGDTMTGDLNMSGTQKVTNLAEPTSAQDAATKQYVDNIAAGLDPKESVRVATVADLSATYATTPNNGRFTSAPSTIDGVALSVGDRVLVKDQIDAKQNGIYVYTAANELTRSADMDGSPASEVSAGNYTFTTAGTVNAARGYVITGNGILTLNVDDINFTQFSGASNAALRDLSNLTSPTAINQDLLADIDNTRDLGSSARRYAETHTQSVINTGANLTLQSTTGKIVLSGTSVNTPSASTDPGSPAEDDLYYNTALDKFKYFDGTQWRQVATKDESNFILNGYADSSTTGWTAYNDTQTVTITIATPAVFTVGSTTGLYVGMPVTFTTTGALPTGLVSGTTYFISAIPSGTTFRVSATLGGADVNTSGTQSGVHTFRPGVPVDATGGTANITFTASATSPLSGQNSFILTKDAAIREGEGVSYQFTIDDASKAKVLQIQFDYLVNSGTFAAGGSTTDSDVLVYILDVTNNRLIQPTTFKLFSSSSTIVDKFISNFQSSGDSVSYRLIFHCATTSASAFSLKLDNVVISPTTLSYGTPITDWVDFPSVAAGTLITATTTNPTYGTTSTNKAQWRRVGANAEIRWNFRQTTSGTAGSGTYLFNIPSVIGSIDTSRVAVSTGTNVTDYTQGAVGTCYYSSDGSSFQAVGTVGAHSASQLKMMFLGMNGGVSAGTLASTQNASFFSLNSSTIAFSLIASVPIQGWSAQVQSSDVNDQRIVSASYWCSANRSSDTSTPINYDSRDIDTHGAVTTGSGWRFTAPISGVYNVQLAAHAGNVVSYGLLIYKNGVAFKSLAFNNSSTSTINGSTSIQLNAGEYIDIRSSIAVVITGGTLATANVANISITRVANPASITSTETIAASYTVTSSTVVNVDNRFNLDTRVFDTHNAVTTGSSWNFKAPVSGLYQVSFSFNTGTASSVPQLFRNGSYYRTMSWGISGTVNNGNFGGTTLIRLNGGDEIYLVNRFTSLTMTFQAGQTAATLQGSNYIDIIKIGI